MGRHVAWRVAALAVVLSAAACHGGTNLEGDAADGRDDGDGSVADDSSPRDDVGGDADADADGDADVEADACVPDCEGRVCGDDGCGNSCTPGCTSTEHCVPATGECATGRGWVEVPSRTPSDVGYYAMAYDSARGVAVLAGERYFEAEVFETWEHGGFGWRRVAPATSPPARDGHAMTYDSARGVVVLFGGHSPSGTLADTWEYDGTTWREITPPTSPPPHSGHAMTYDSARGVVVLFGGGDAGGTRALADTWEYDGTTWRGVTPAASPPGRRGHAMAYDSTRGGVVLFGGATRTTLFDDTWEYDGTTWTNVAAPASHARSGHTMAFDSARGVTVLFGGVWSILGMLARCWDTWEYDGRGYVLDSSNPHG